MSIFSRSRRDTPAPAEQSASTEAPPWPDGVIARYLTVGGATVDITNNGRHHWHCTACPASSHGAYTGPWGTPFTRDEIHEQANEHAEVCRSMPKPGSVA